MENVLYQVLLTQYRGEWTAKIFAGGVLASEGRDFSPSSAVEDAFEKLEVEKE
jgi:hypothetical protein